MLEGKGDARPQTQDFEPDYQLWFVSASEDNCAINALLLSVVVTFSAYKHAFA